MPDERHLREPEFIAPVELAAGTGAPVQQYAMIDNALRRAEGMTIAEHRAEIADLWARCNVVARSNPRAAFANPRSAHDIDTPGPANRPLAFPYNKWHASQWTVDQGAALLMCSAEAARRHGVAPERWVFPLVGIDAEHSVSLSRRRLLHRWPAMAVLGKAAAARIGRPLAEAEFIEVYSCFPAAVRVQQRELGLALDGTPTLTGGMAFAGGPFNNFVYQSTAMVVAAVRSTPGSLGVVTTVCGLLTKPGLAVWSTEPDGRPPLLDDLGPLAARATPEVTVVRVPRRSGHRGHLHGDLRPGNHGASPAGRAGRHGERGALPGRGRRPGARRRGHRRRVLRHDRRCAGHLVQRLSQAVAPGAGASSAPAFTARRAAG